MNKMADVSHGPFALELLEKSDDLLSKMYQNPNEQLEEIESWIYKKREERRLREEEESAAVLQKEFLDYVSAVKELIGKKHEKIVAWAKMMAVLQKKLEVLATDAEREALETQVKEALEMQRLGEEQIESLTKGIEEKRGAIEERHKHEIEEIREKYSTVSKIEEETNILKIILPDVQAYFRNVAVDMKGFLDAQRQTVMNKIAGERQTPGYASLDRVENGTGSSDKEEVTIETEVKVMSSIKSSQEINNNCVGTLVHKEVEVVAELHVAREANDFEDEASEDESNYMVNGVIMEEEEEEEEEVKENVERSKEGIVDYAQ